MELKIGEEFIVGDTLIGKITNDIALVVGKNPYFYTLLMGGVEFSVALDVAKGIWQRKSYVDGPSYAFATRVVDGELVEDITGILAEEYDKIVDFKKGKFRDYV